MRPNILNPLFAPVESLSGVGSKSAKAIEHCAGPFIVDLLWHLPSSFIERKYYSRIIDAPLHKIVILKGTVESHQKPAVRRLPYKVICSDASSKFTLVFFNSRVDYLKNILPIGRTIVISGKLEQYDNTFQIIHPDHIVFESDRDKIKCVEPVYPLTEGLNLKPLSKAINTVLELMPDIPEWCREEFLEKYSWPPWKTALLSIHRQPSEESLKGNTPARNRVAYDELLANQLAIALVRSSMHKTAARKLNGTGQLTAEIRKNLPFTLTADQNKAIQEITNDLALPHRMLRLLQGDVGSGKTIVALFTMLIAVEAGAQAALVAPTEILARQHKKTIERMLNRSNIKIELLTGRTKKSIRNNTLKKLANGEIDIVIGTHALFQSGVKFSDLAVAIIDEQHRFGVHQRIAMATKGESVHMLVMTATPIPRTLLLTAYGDLDSSRLIQKPRNRTTIDTRVMPISRLEEVINGTCRSIEKSERIFWVCPLINESTALDVAAVNLRFAELRKIFGNRVGLIHGNMTETDRDQNMTAFTNGKIDILVATTVIEVGIDVPDATIMIIEHAERFGLAQLHQLRGRIGRSHRRSTCVLLYNSPLTEMAHARLNIMRNTSDGFRIAEEDLKLRGEGEILGVRQSGLPELRLANITSYKALLELARKDARLTLKQDPKLESKRGQALRILLYLFRRATVAGYLNST